VAHPPSRPRRLHRAPVAALALAGTATVACAGMATVPPSRVALQARVEAVRGALAQADAAPDAAASPMGWLLAQATNWTNWPKWSKWSNWANK
jgi:hypothetical protein